MKNVEKCELFAKTLENIFSLNNIFNIESEIAVYDKLAESEISPQYISPHTTLEAIIEIIKKNYQTKNLPLKISSQKLF